LAMASAMPALEMDFSWYPMKPPLATANAASLCYWPRIFRNSMVNGS
jgi:hypothetical protein